MVTNYIRNATYKEIYDIHNDTEQDTILTFHSPITRFPRDMLGGFFSQYRRFKYKGMRLSIRPASTLPADPAQIGVVAGEPTIDARDMLNPMLIRGYCGDSLGTFLNLWNYPGVQARWAQDGVGGTTSRVAGSGRSGSSMDIAAFPDLGPTFTNGEYLTGDARTSYLNKLYYQSLSDPKFHKVYPQRGYSRKFTPLVYELATTTQRLSHDYLQNILESPPNQSSASGGLTGVTASVQDWNERSLEPDFGGNATSDTYPLQDGAIVPTQGKSPISAIPETVYYTSTTGTAGASPSTRIYSARRQVPILTSHKRPLGWLDTDTRVVPVMNIQGAGNGTTVQNLSGDNNFIPGVPGNNVVSFDVTSNTVLPLINMAVAILPKAWRTENYMRVTITHLFDFKDYRPLCGLVSPFDESCMEGPTLEWADWDDKTILESKSSITSSTKDTVELIDVVGGQDTVSDSE